MLENKWENGLDKFWPHIDTKFGNNNGSNNVSPKIPHFHESMYIKEEDYNNYYETPKNT
jgi:hypothetical protein